MAHSSPQKQPSSFKNPPKYRFKDGLFPALPMDYKRSPESFIDCSVLSTEEQIRLCNEHIALLREKIADRAEKRRVIREKIASGVKVIAFPGITDVYEEAIAQERQWIEYFQTPLSAKTLIREPKSKKKPLLPLSDKRNQGNPSTFVSSENEPRTLLEASLLLDESYSVQIGQLASIRTWQKSHPEQWSKLIEVQVVALRQDRKLVVSKPLPFIVGVVDEHRQPLGQIGVGLLSGRWQVKLEGDFRWQPVDSVEQGFGLLK